jgi:hypothetical protein
MNCRTEIAMGLMNDGCTSLYWKRDHRAILAQNWDASASTFSCPPNADITYSGSIDNSKTSLQSILINSTSLQSP